MKTQLRIAILLALALALALVVPALAQEPAPTPSVDEVNAIAKNMFCPVCENIPLDVCGTQACALWREQIYDLLVEGYTEQEIYDYFVLHYGDRVLGQPPRRGLNWLVYIVPPLAFMGMVVFLVNYFRNMRIRSFAPAEDQAASQAESENPYLSRIEEELKKRG